ncbi:hypothetical protein DL766_010535 [Monosporascus sp. MC13-8B]|uniref:Uncharacterized protein n=1 Tax=Monosporascus cannonballus TaxID=155416 RepID=A0ABY0HHK4_9PEZI|nr:hypothetical protein DL762_001050 [Monosporascus cannonballus]RYP00119.1 hypothetical protein DL763_001048 [Monosporascus cannonballus]RYP02042.1 hypothetical protein DL766_010535 [Monosporascus sp. MC13-8B]
MADHDKSKKGEPRPSLAVADPNKFWMRDGQSLNQWTELLSDPYSAEAFTGGVLGYFRNRTPEEKAPKEFGDLYEGVYDEGQAKLRQRRLERPFELGLVPKEVEPAPMFGLLDPDRKTLSPEERAASARKMEAFAATLHGLGQALEALPMPKGAASMGALIEKHYDNSLENIGNRDSFTWYGANRACAPMAPSRGFKTWIAEGGIRCPCLVRVSAADGHRHRHNERAAHQRLHDGHGRAAEGARTCGSAAGELHHPDTTITGWELFGLRVIRQGTWKAVYMTAPRGCEAWELYEMEADSGDTRDLAERESEVLNRLVQHWNVYCSEIGMFDPDRVYHVVKDTRVT